MAVKKSPSSNEIDQEAVSASAKISGIFFSSGAWNEAAGPFQKGTSRSESERTSCDREPRTIGPAETIEQTQVKPISDRAPTFGRAEFTINPPRTPSISSGRAFQMCSPGVRPRCIVAPSRHAQAGHVPSEARFRDGILALVVCPVPTSFDLNSPR
jgi:hypothetical protein